MAEEQAPSITESKKRSLKTALMVLALLVGEAALLMGAVMFIGGEPAETAGAVIDAEPLPDERIVEILVLDGKLPNAKTGVTYLYSTEIYVQVKQRYTQRVEDELSQFANEIKADLTALWRTSEPPHFKEPRLENLTRKVHALLNERFGIDPENEEPVVSKVVINMQPGFRIDA